MRETLQYDSRQRFWFLDFRATRVETSTNAAYIYCRLKFLDSAHAQLKKALIYPDTYRVGEEGLKRFDWDICGHEFFCKYALKKLQIEKYPDMCGHGHKHNYRLYKFQLL